MTVRKPKSRLLSLDPDSHRIGYATFGLEKADILYGGLVTPHKSNLPFEVRVKSLLQELGALLVDENGQIGKVLVEMPTGKQYSRKGRQSALPVWACAAGAVFGYLVGRSDVQTVAVSNTGWTKGIGAKGDRQLMVRTIFPQYDPELDRGCHVGDAILMARWWFARKREAEIGLAGETR